MSEPETSAAVLEHLLAGSVRGLHAVYQPIVELDTGAVVAHEALARGPAGTALATPAALFAEADRAGRTAELDWMCRRGAIEGALEVPPSGSLPLFINVEPTTLGLPEPDRFDDIRSAAHLRIVLEVTERAVADHPAELLDAVRRARALGCSIAIDDLGANSDSLALLPLIAPDVIKLDMALTWSRPNASVAAVMTAAQAEAERTGATILAEGIETEAHLAHAQGLGARLGQGYLFGHPGRLRARDAAPGWTPGATTPRAPSGRTPYEVVAAARPTRASTKALLIAMSKHLEAQASALPSPGVILSAFQYRQHVTPATVDRYAALAERCALVVAMGSGVAPEPAPGVRGLDLAPTDPLCGEWSVVVVGAHYAAALVARDLGDEGPQAQRRFDHALTHDRELVLRAADTIIDRLSDPRDGRRAAVSSGSL